MALRMSAAESAPAEPSPVQAAAESSAQPSEAAPPQAPQKVGEERTWIAHCPVMCSCFTTHGHGNYAVHGNQQKHVTGLSKSVSHSICPVPLVNLPYDYRRLRSCSRRRRLPCRRRRTPRGPAAVASRSGYPTAAACSASSARQRRSACCAPSAWLPAPKPPPAGRSA